MSVEDHHRRVLERQNRVKSGYVTLRMILLEARRRDWIEQKALTLRIGSVSHEIFLIPAALIHSPSLGFPNIEGLPRRASSLNG